MFTGLQANRNKNDSKLASFAMTAGHGSRTGASGAVLRGVRGMVRAGEDGNKGKCGEMNHPCQSQAKKRENVSKPIPRKTFFTFIFPL